ncbi:hypothetical protein K5D33_07265 [Pseudomonas cichorii]|nr:hypothetical protein [Pseudomonas cichorii]MBX8534522.1 hypothetical protein [Pseudomonas cichorii]
MSVSHKEFHEQAIRLVSENSEIDNRSAISRSYYAIYHCAIETAARLALPECEKRDAGVHERLFLRIESQGKALKKIARRLRDKKRVRGVADYDLEEDVPVSDAEIFIRDARLLMADLEKLGQAQSEARQ